MGDTGRGIRDQGGVQSPRVTLESLSRKIENMTRIGTVSHADYKKGKVRVTFGDPKSDDKIVSQWLPWGTQRAGLNRTYSAPEIGEQVLVHSPSGDLANGVVTHCINKKKYPHEADSPHITKTTFRSSKGKVTGFQEYNRETGVHRIHLDEKSTFRLEIGGKSSLIIHKDHIQVKVGDTQMVLKPEELVAHVKGNESSFQMLPKSITHRVQASGMMHLTDQLFHASIDKVAQLAISKAAISLGLLHAKVGLDMSLTSLQTVVQTSYHKLEAAAATLFGGSSGINCIPGGIKALSPTFEGIMGAHPPGIFGIIASILPASINPFKTLKAPDPAKTVVPDMPTD